MRFVPRWPGAIQGRAVNLCRNFYPKLAAHEEFSDLLQEAYIVFMRCKSKFYADGTPQLFMAFYSRSLHNKLCSMLKATPREAWLEEIELGSNEPMQDDLGHLLCVLREMPDEILQLLGELSTDLSLEAERKVKTRVQKIIKRGFLMRKIVPTVQSSSSPAIAAAQV